MRDSTQRTCFNSPNYNPHGEAWQDTAWEKMNSDEDTINWNVSIRAGQICYMFDILGGDNAPVAQKTWEDLDCVMEGRLARQVGISNPRMHFPSTETMSAQNVTTIYIVSGD